MHIKQLKKDLSTALIAALLLTQQGSVFSALALTVARSQAPGRGSVVVPVGRMIPLGAVLSAPSLTPASLTPALSVSLPNVTVAPSVNAAAPEVRLAQIAQSLQPELKALSGPALSADQTQSAGEKVMDKALGGAARDLPSYDLQSAAAAGNGSGARPLSLQPAARDSWWKDPSSNHAAVTVPLYALRREKSDPGVGKFTDLGTYYRDVLAKQGVDVIHLLPHFAVLDESPYAPVSLYALNEDNLDWAQVDEVKGRPELLKRLIVSERADKQKVNYGALRQREGAVAREAYGIFQAEHLSRDTPRAGEYRAYVRQNSGWLADYAEFMTLSKLIGKPVLDWSKGDEARARATPGFALMAETHKYAQWNASLQFRQAMETIHAAGGKAIFDIPMFRAKNSVDAWKHPEYFTDLRTRNPGIKNQYINEDWGDLALWNWTKLKAEGYKTTLAPFSHWLDNGFDGARVDALHFAYNFGNGQLASGDEPGDDYVGALSAVFKKRGAFPVAEAFEGKAENAARYGFVTVYGDWKKLSSHDDPRSDGFMGRFIDLSKQAVSGRSGRFVGYTLGDEWGDTLPVKESKNGRSYWSYRIPMPADPDFKDRAKNDVRGQLGGLKAVQEGRVWQASQAVWNAFRKAADGFIKHFNGSVQIWAASMDWFLEEWGRDTFISLPGLLLATGRYDEAKENIRNFAKYEHEGLIPNRIWDASRWSPQKPDGADYNTVDGSLWFMQAVKRYGEQTKDWAFVAEMLPVLRRVMAKYASGTGYDRYGRFNRIYMDSDGLIVSPAQATWMDADPEGRDKPVTPRNGKAVEINALWYADLRFLARMEKRSGDKAAAALYDERAEQVKKSFNEKFWFESEDNKRAWGGSGGALRDVVEGDLHGEAIRPNMLFAVSHGEDLLSAERQHDVVLAATKDLLTPYGMRTLSPRDSGYRPVYETWRPPSEKDLAYHQGTVWPWLIGAYVDALVKVRQAQSWDAARIQDEVRGIMTPLVEFLVTHPEGSLPEVFDGGLPQVRQNPGGTRSQAWSVGEVMRVLLEQGLVPKAQKH